MVQRKDEDEDYITRRKVIMMISSESDEDYTPKRPAENKEKEKSDTKKSDEPIKMGKKENCDFESGSSSAPHTKRIKQGIESLNEGTSVFKTPSSESDAS